MSQYVEAVWQRECRQRVMTYISPEMGEAERQSLIDNATNQLLNSISGSMRGSDPTTLRIVIGEETSDD